MRAIGFPQLYCQGWGLINELASFVGKLGSKPCIVLDKFIYESFADKITLILQKENITPFFAHFKGECTAEEIERLTLLCKKEQCDSILAMGGGKVIDAGKGVKIETKLPIIVFPTIASNDAPTSRVVVLYKENGDFLGPRFLAFNPELVIVDSEIIAAAPLRFLVAGIGDALVTKFEAEQCQASKVNNFFGGLRPQIALNIAEACYQSIRKYSVQAVADVKNKVKNSQALEEIIEANVLLSGLGFEGCGVAAAHAISQGFSLIPQMHSMLHGEETAVGLIAQFVLEERSETFINEILEFYRSINLPASLADLGLINPTEQDLNTIVNFACREKSRIYNMSVTINVDKVKAALIKANEMALATKASKNKA